MTSVLYSSGLNYQRGNPMGSELRGLERRVIEIESAFAGVNANIQKTLSSHTGATDGSEKKIAELKAIVESQQKDLDSKITDLKTQVDGMQSLMDVLKMRVDRADAAIASASAAATQAKTIATAAAADAASASASAAAAAAAVTPASA